MSKIWIQDGIISSSDTISHDIDNNTILQVKDSGINIAGIVTSSGNIYTEANIIQTEDETRIYSDDFQSGFAGSGFQIDRGITDSSKTHAEFDTLMVRGTFDVFELLIHQIRATNGSIWVSNTGKVSESIQQGATNYFTMSFDTGEGYGHGFDTDDLIRFQRWDNASSSIIQSDLLVENVDGTGSVYVSKSSGDDPAAGYEYVRIGNTTNTDRQGAVYLTADDSNAPYIDVIDGVTTFDFSNNIKTRMGKLSGITSDYFEALSGYGFWASGSVYLEGSINATSGSIAGWNIHSDAIQKNDIEINSNTGYISIGGATGITDSGVYFNNSGHALIGDYSGEYIQWDGSDLNIKSSHLNITASDIDITTDQFHLSSSTIVVDSNEGGKIKLGDWADTQTFTEYNGIYLSGSGEFVFGDDDGAYISFIDDTLNISSSNFSVIDGNVSASNAWFDGTISASAGNIGGWNINATQIYSDNLYLDGANQKIYVGAGNFNNVDTAFYVDDDSQFSLKNKFVFDGTDLYMTGSISASAGHFTGQIVANSGRIGNWNILNNEIYNGNLKLTSTGEISSSNFFVNNAGNLTASNALLSGSLYASYINASVGGLIAGWAISSDKLTAEKIELDSSGIIRQTDDYWQLSEDGSGQLANNNIRWDTAGNLIITGSISASSGHFTGQIVADSGNIGNWIIDGTRIYNNNLELSANGEISSSNFFVDNAGNLTASNANIQGILSSSEGNIAGWTINDTAIYKDDILLSSLSSSLLVQNDNSNTIIRVGSGSMTDTTETGSNLINEPNFDLIGDWYTDSTEEVNFGWYETDRIVTGSVSDGSYTSVNLLEGYLTQSFTADNISVNESIILTYDRRRYDGASAEAETDKLDYHDNIILEYSDDGGSTWNTVGTETITIPHSPDLRTATTIFTTDTAINDTDLFKLILTSSFEIVEGTYTQAAIDNTYYDNFKLYHRVPITELVNNGLLVYSNPYRYIKATKEGIIIKGGDIDANRIVANDLEVYGDVSLFGGVEASTIPPYNNNPEDVGTTPAVGTATAYSRGDHVHDLTVGTLNTVLIGSDLSSSLQGRTTDNETDIGALQTDSGSFEGRITDNETNISNLQTDSGSFSTRVTNNETNITLIGSYTSSLATNLHGLTETEVTELLNINDVTITNTQWGYLGELDQSLITTANVLFNNITASGNISASGYMSASYFVGDGNGLTNLNPESFDLEDLTDGDGIVDFTYDGTTAATVAVASSIAGNNLDWSSGVINHSGGGANNITVADGNIINSLTIDTYGHVTDSGSYDLDNRYYTETEITDQFVSQSGDEMTGDLYVNANISSSGDIYAPNIGSGEDNSVIVLQGNNFKTDEINPIVWDNSATFLSSSDGADNRVAVYTSPSGIEGDTNLTWDGSILSITGKLEATSKSFVTKSPNGKRVEYGVLEGTQNRVYVNGELNGENIINLPEEWKWLIDESTITCQLTSIGKHQQLFIEKIEDNNIFINISGMLKNKKHIHCYYLVHAERKDIERIKRD